MTLREKIRAFFDFIFPVKQFKLFFTKRKFELDWLRAKGNLLRHADESTAKRIAECNHRKGGMVVDRTGHVQMPTKGTDNQYSVIKHQFANGDFWVLCTRCPKKWKPGDPDYEKALAFPINNVASGALLLKFSDGGKAYREAIKNS